MITMSVPPNGGGPPLPKRTSSQRQPRVTNHALQALRSNSADSPPPLPPHHPESKTLPRTKKNEAPVSVKNDNAPEVPTRAGRRVFEDGGPGIQKKTFETKSFVERNAARVFSDPTKLENKSVKIRRSYNPPPTRALPALPPEPAESNLKQNLRDRPLPPPPSAESIPSPERSPSAPDHERPLPPPPSIKTIPTGRRPSVADISTHSDEPLPPPPPIQSIPTKSASGKAIHIPAAFDTNATNSTKKVKISPKNNIPTILLKLCKGQPRSYPSKILTEPHYEEHIATSSISDCGSASASTEDLVHPTSSQTRSTVLHVDLKFGDGHVLYQPNSHQLLDYKVSLQLQVSYSYATVVSLDTFTKTAKDRAPVRVKFIMEPPNTPAQPPLSKQPNTYHVKLQQQSSDDTPPPLPPSRPRGQSLGSKSSQHGSTNTHEYEKRFVFHDESEFPEPKSFSGKKKEYPSQVIDKRKTRVQNSLGAL